MEKVKDKGEQDGMITKEEKGILELQNGEKTKGRESKIKQRGN